MCIISVETWINTDKSVELQLWGGGTSARIKRHTDTSSTVCPTIFPVHQTIINHHPSLSLQPIITHTHVHTGQTLQCKQPSSSGSLRFHGNKLLCNENCRQQKKETEGWIEQKGDKGRHKYINKCYCLGHFLDLQCVFNFPPNDQALSELLKCSADTIKWRKFQNMLSYNQVYCSEASDWRTFINLSHFFLFFFMHSALLFLPNDRLIIRWAISWFLIFHLSMSYFTLPTHFITILLSSANSG